MSEQLSMGAIDNASACASHDRYCESCHHSRQRCSCNLHYSSCSCQDDHYDCRYHELLRLGRIDCSSRRSCSCGRRICISRNLDHQHHSHHHYCGKLPFDRIHSTCGCSSVNSYRRSCCSRNDHERHCSRCCCANCTAGRSIPSTSCCCSRPVSIRNDHAASYTAGIRTAADPNAMQPEHISSPVSAVEHNHVIDHVGGPIRTSADPTRMRPEYMNSPSIGEHHMIDHNGVRSLMRKAKKKLAAVAKQLRRNLYSENTRNATNGAAVQMMMPSSTTRLDVKTYGDSPTTTTNDERAHLLLSSPTTPASVRGQYVKMRMECESRASSFDFKDMIRWVNSNSNRCKANINLQDPPRHSLDERELQLHKARRHNSLSFARDSSPSASVNYSTVKAFADGSAVGELLATKHLNRHGGFESRRRRSLGVVARLMGLDDDGADMTRGRLLRHHRGYDHTAAAAQVRMHRSSAGSFDCRGRTTTAAVAAATTTRKFDGLRCSCRVRSPTQTVSWWSHDHNRCCTGTTDLNSCRCFSHAGYSAPPTSFSCGSPLAASSMSPSSDAGPQASFCSSPVDAALMSPKCSGIRRVAASSQYSAAIGHRRQQQQQVQGIGNCAEAGHPFRGRRSPERPLMAAKEEQELSNNDSQIATATPVSHVMVDCGHHQGSEAAASVDATGRRRRLTRMAPDEVKKKNSKQPPQIVLLKQSSARCEDIAVGSAANVHPHGVCMAASKEQDLENDTTSAGRHVERHPPDLERCPMWVGTLSPDPSSSRLCKVGTPLFLVDGVAAAVAAMEATSSRSAAGAAPIVIMIPSSTPPYRMHREGAAVDHECMKAQDRRRIRRATTATPGDACLDDIDTVNGQNSHAYDTHPKQSCWRTPPPPVEQQQSEEVVEDVVVHDVDDDDASDESAAAVPAPQYLSPSSNSEAAALAPQYLSSPPSNSPTAALDLAPQYLSPPWNSTAAADQHISTHPLLRQKDKVHALELPERRQVEVHDPSGRVSRDYQVTSDDSIERRPQSSAVCVGAVPTITAERSTATTSADSITSKCRSTEVLYIQQVLEASGFLQQLQLAKSTRSHYDLQHRRQFLTRCSRPVTPSMSDVDGGNYYMNSDVLLQPQHMYRAVAWWLKQCAVGGGDQLLDAQLRPEIYERLELEWEKVTDKEAEEELLLIQKLQEHRLTASGGGTSSATAAAAGVEHHATGHQEQVVKVDEVKSRCMLVVATDDMGGELYRMSRQAAMRRKLVFDCVSQLLGLTMKRCFVSLLFGNCYGNYCAIFDYRPTTTAVGRQSQRETEMLELHMGVAACLWEEVKKLEMVAQAEPLHNGSSCCSRRCSHFSRRSSKSSGEWRGNSQRSSRRVLAAEYWRKGSSRRRRELMEHVVAEEEEQLRQQEEAEMVVWAMVERDLQLSALHLLLPSSILTIAAELEDLLLHSLLSDMLLDFVRTHLQFDGVLSP